MANVYVSRGATTLGAVSNGDAVFLLGGSASVTSGLDLSGIASITLLSVGDDFNGQIGTAANPLKANIATKINYGASGGDLYFQSQGSGSSTSTLLYVFGGGHFHFLTGGTLTRADVANGKMTISSACTATNLRISGGSVHLFGTAGMAPTLLKNIGGYCLTERGADHAGTRWWRHEGPGRHQLDRHHRCGGRGIGTCGMRHDRAAEPLQWRARNEETDSATYHHELQHQYEPAGGGGLPRSRSADVHLCGRSHFRWRWPAAGLMTIRSRILTVPSPPFPFRWGRGQGEGELRSTHVRQES